MGNFYLDIETTGFDIEKDKIITIQYQKMSSFKGNPEGELVILKEWESSEETIVKAIYKEILSDNVWQFVPVGTNFIFDFNFLFSKFKKYNLPCPELSKYLFNKPVIDLKFTLILANQMSFKGSGLDQMSKKKADGRNIPIWYEKKEYDKIIDYIVQETESFMEIFQKILQDLIKLKMSLIKSEPQMYCEGCNSTIKSCYACGGVFYSGMKVACDDGYHNCLVCADEDKRPESEYKVITKDGI